MNDLFDWMNSGQLRTGLPGFSSEVYEKQLAEGARIEGFPTVDENGQWVRPGMMSPAGRKPLVAS